MLVTLVSGKSAPGTTTTALALAFSWPSPVLLVDADPAGGDVLPGLLAGRASADRGLLTWAVATRRAAAHDAVAAVGEHVYTLPEAPHVWVMPGVQTAGQGRSLGGSWTRISAALERVTADTALDVLVDVGRLSEDSAWPLMGAADLVLLVTRCTARSVVAAAAAAAALRDGLGDWDRTRLIVLTRGDYRPGQVQQHVGPRPLGRIADDPRTAASLVDGAPLQLLGLSRSKLLRSVADLPSRIDRLTAAGPTKHTTGHTGIGTSGHTSGHTGNDTGEGAHEDPTEDHAEGRHA